MQAGLHKIPRKRSENLSTLLWQFLFANQPTNQQLQSSLKFETKLEVGFFLSASRNYCYCPESILELTNHFLYIIICTFLRLTRAE